MINYAIIISAILMGLSQQPWGLGFFAWFSLYPYIHFFNKQKGYIDTIKYSLLWGFIYHLSFMYWLSGNVGIDNMILKYFTMILVALFLSLNFILINTLFIFFKKHCSKYYSIYMLPLIFVSVEYMRSFGLYGFTWNSLSYSQTEYITPSQIIEYTGIYGLTFWIVLVNVIIYDLLKHYSKIKLSCLTLTFIIPWILGYVIKQNIPEPNSFINTKIIQPNISLENKRLDINQSLNKLISLSTLSKVDSTDIIIWPESSISSRFLNNNKYNKNYSSRMNNFLKKDNINLVAGIEARYTNERYNSSILFKSDSIAYIYHKQRLVPNVEHTPKFFDILGYNLGVDNFNIGKNLTMFNINGIDFASMVCLESIFPNPTRSFVNEGAKFLVYIVNDGWYIKPPEPQQHAKRCIYRAIENRRTVLRSANTGISMIVNPYGNITNFLELNKSGSINAQIEILDKITFYTKYGNLFSIFNVVILFILSLYIIFRRLFKNV